MSDAEDVVRLATASGTTVAVAESLTAGLVCARIADVPGASAVLRGGVVTYATDVKTLLLGVDAHLLRRRGAVDPDVALAMAAGVRERLGADVGLATTGVAGPDPQDGVAPGAVFVAVSHPTRDPDPHPLRDQALRSPWEGSKCRITTDGVVWRLTLEGDRAAVRTGATDAAVALLSVVLTTI